MRSSYKILTRYFTLHRLAIALLCLPLTQCSPWGKEPARQVLDFNANWRFNIISNGSYFDSSYNDSGWRLLNLPHDWSIEGAFSPDHPATVGGGALPGGVGWYRKSFKLPMKTEGRRVFIQFDGIYMNSEVWINGHYLGKRPNGYIGFQYELTPYLNPFGSDNLIAVRVDNSLQPNSRWYTGSGIYRNVRMVITRNIHVDNWGTFITTPTVSEREATVSIRTWVVNSLSEDQHLTITTTLFNSRGKKVGESSTDLQVTPASTTEVEHRVRVRKPTLWSVDNPYMYKAITTLERKGEVMDTYVTPFGIRFFEFDSQRGFLLNGKPLKILGVCNHHDLGCLGAAVNTRALERQLEILKEMGCNGIRTAHNPPTPELLELCNRMGFIVMVEAFDMWSMRKSSFDYHLHWDQWHRQDLEDLIRRDRNHPSVFMWSIGNEVIEQWHREEGLRISKELANIVRTLDPTRPITAGCNNSSPSNPLFLSGALDIIGFNYEHKHYHSVPDSFPGMPFIATETTSALATRGAYDMPSDSIRVWPVRWDVPVPGNPDFTCSAYDNCHVGWGTTHMETWRLVKQHDFISGMYIWTGFDYLGEPTPYSWPARSSYFGIIDLAGFPKDSYYMYQSEWTSKPVLHIFPHWNWVAGDTVDVWAYTNASEVELLLNNQSLGRKTKGNNDLHLKWRVPFSPGLVSAIAIFADGSQKVQEVRTAGKPHSIRLSPDRSTIAADGKDLSFVTVTILDKQGVVVPYANNLVNFQIEGNGFIAGVDNGNPISHEPFKANFRRAFNGKCLVVIQSDGTPGRVNLHATADGLLGALVVINSKK